MSVNRHKIQIKDENSKKVTLELTDGCTYIPLQNLQQYFPAMSGLTYEKDGKVYAVILKNNNIQLNPGVRIYKVFYSKKLDVESIVKEYMKTSYTYSEICQMLSVKWHYKISVRSLRRLVRKMNLKRKNIVESPVEEILSAIIEEVYECGFNLGYRALWQRLKMIYNLYVKQATVLKMLNLVDPEGIEQRSKYRLKRRRYSVPGPNYLWHVDGFDKLKPFGFAVSACVDGFSRKVIWLQQSTTNNKPEVIAFYFLKAVIEHNCTASIVRSDRGTENTLIDLIQQAIRHMHRDENAKEKSFVKGKSTANERIEKYWKHLRNHTSEWYITLFKTMQDRGELDTSNIMHIECLRYCFGSLLNHDLKNAMNECNEHRIRKQKGLSIPCGIPNVMYHWPERYRGTDCRQHISIEDINRLMEKFTVKPKYYDPKIEELIKLIKPDVEIPCITEEAFTLYLEITQFLNSHG